MISECNMERISVKDAKVILAAIDFYTGEMVSRRKNKLLKIKKEECLVEELRVLKEKIEDSETDNGLSVKEIIAKKEEQLYSKFIKEGRTEEDLQGIFMYEELFKK